MPGIRILEGMGLRVRTGASVRARDGYFAGSDARRVCDLDALLGDDEVRAILFARGGYGTSRILEALPWKTIERRPKILLGYSDLTALFAAAVDRAGLSCAYGPVVAELGDRHRYDLRSFERALFDPGRPLEIRFARRSVLARGRAKGRLAGGCLSLLAHLAGTPWAPRTKGRVLLLEEIGEEPYRIDRMLTQMRMAGMLEDLAGVLVGSLTGCRPRKGFGPSPSALDVVASFFMNAGIPVIAGLPIGHLAGKITVPLGFEARIDTAAGRIVLAP